MARPRVFRVLFIVYLLATGVLPYGEFPSDANHADAPAKFWVDCTNGNDGTGVGSSAAPYKTITFSQNTALALETEWEYMLVINNGPCNEPKVTIQEAIKYVGNGVSPVKITNGMTYTSVNQEFTNIELSNLWIPVLNISMLASQNQYYPNFMNCKIGYATILGTSYYGTTAAQFWYTTATYQMLTGTVNIYYGTSTINNVGTLGYVLVQGGSVSGTTNVGSAATVRLIGGSVASATFTSSLTGLNKPTIWYGTDTAILPTVSGMDIITHTNDCNSQQLFGSVTLTISGSAAVVFGCAMTGNYGVSLSYASGLLSVPGISAQTTGGFTISGAAGSTIGWVASKQI